MDPNLSAFFRNVKFSAVLQKTLVTLLLIAGAILLEIRLIYALFVSVIVNLIFHTLGLTWKVVWKTLPRDIVAASRLIRLKIITWRFARQNATIADVFLRNVRSTPDKAAFRYEEQTWTFRDMEEYSNQVAHFFASHTSLSAGDSVALLMTSRPEYVGIWLGVSKIDCAAALVNFQLRGESLLHSLQAVQMKALIVGEELRDAVEEVRASIMGVPIYVVGERGSIPSGTPYPPHVLSIDRLLLQMSKSRPEFNGRVKRSTNTLFYIYTSGTTGLPKAAIISHARFFYMSCGMKTMINIKDDDVMYCALPLYHTAGGVLGMGQSIVGGITVVIRKKFSASQFWKDCIQYNCTIAQYIGEICRYILSQKESPTDRMHRVRLMFGNGLRNQIWADFQKRFGVKQMAEFYGATEGNASLINIDNTIGAVGFVSRIVPWIYPVKLIRAHPETGEPLRDSKGMCIPCKPGEAGELVGKIKTSGIHKFDGYCNQEATMKKIAHDVFRKGDLAFLTGDILVMDDYGYLYFRDRTGDTFRWKGENVSTNEVEAAIGKIVGLEAVVVFGVSVPGYEGKAGMVCITGDERKHDLRKLSDEMKHSLPSYARPLFVRFVSQVEETGTFKLIKSRLKEEGFDPQCLGRDVLYYLDPSVDEYKLMLPDNYRQIVNGKVRY
ncbi:long-chain fatty acid transport protein 4-like [Paramacrobiotus metropolitanus]|uniref:long-chain fatty acid transport protein 4-like n=1 Tax=Paramacrobiotus metropolitanus TaxID=2943436 RepID=UPI00244626BC|nr:long-chain fatty acid transport protein 4-like [Paramacrobiotus metropolitanus]